MGEFGAFLDLFKGNGGVVPLLLLNVFVLAVGAYRAWWVPGRQYQRLERRCDRWQQLALQSLAEGDKTATLAEFFRGVAGDGV